MEIILSRELEDLIHEKMRSGKYSSPGEVVGDGLRLLKKLDKQQNDLREQIQKGRDAIKKGNFTVYNSADEMIESVISEARDDFETKKSNGK